MWHVSQVCSYSLNQLRITVEFKETKMQFCDKTTKHEFMMMWTEEEERDVLNGHCKL